MPSAELYQLIPDADRKRQQRRFMTVLSTGFVTVMNIEMMIPTSSISIMNDVPHLGWNLRIGRISSTVSGSFAS